MPNGDEIKNYVRLCHAIDGFRAKHGAWPTKALLSEETRRDLEASLEGAALRRLRRMIPIESGKSVSVAGDRRRVFHYGKDGWAQIDHRPRAEEWLGISPHGDLVE